MAINTTKVLVGGVAAGVIFTATDMLSHTVLLGDRMAAELAAAAPGVLERMMATETTVVFVAVNLAFGIALAWLYAAIRPRFGPGPRTAVYAGLFMWFIAAITHSAWAVAGLMSGSSFALVAMIWLVAVLVGALVAGRLYTEPAPAPASTPVV